MKLIDLANIIEETAPLRLQEEWDNSGWQVGPLEEDVKGVLLCVDVTSDVIDEAIELGCNVIISHHPLIFSGLKKLQLSEQTSAMVIKAIQKGISIYSSHTAMDRAFDGVSGRMCSKLGLAECKILDSPDSAEGLGMIGNTDRPYTEMEFLEKVKNVFNCKSIRYSELRGKMVQRVAVCGGSGAFLTESAMEQGADVFVTADVKYHQYFSSLGKMIIADIGHFESEQFTKEIFFDIISKKIPNFAIHFSKKGKSPINSL
ncbi:MAG: Nif3-like dinuclear metal center hexameric protein [Paludibacteraceae bacterium]|nr:Nif3-like dinuclear metal center hexameric protein [Paludibacteraceae bacterium]